MLIAKIKSLSLMRTRLDSLQSKSMHPAGEMLHKIEWEPYTPAPLKTQAPGRLMILSDTKKGIGEKWAAAIKEAILVTPAKAYACIDQNHFTLDPGQPEHFKKLLAACDGLYPLHIVHFWSLDADSRDWERAGQLCCESVVNLLKAIETAPQASLTLITQAATPATAGDFNAVQAMSLGLGKVITLEYPRLNCKMLDLDAQGPTPDAQQLSQVIHSSGGENMLAFRNNQFCVPRIHRLRPSQDSIRFSNEKAYLITGGFGGLGIETAKWLAAGNAGQIILVGRSQANPSAQAAIDSLTANGTQIICFQADIANETDVKNILQQIQANCLPLAGIVHAAGLNEDAMLVQQSADSLRRVMAPKVVGTWHLHRLTQTLDLDFFVCFSSAASITGVEGQGNYAAANAFMDALMHQRHSQGRKALTINWGPWAQVGMAARMHEEAQQRFADRGIGAILAKDALSLMARLLTQDIPQAMVAQIDWSKFASRLPMPLPLLNHLICDTQPAASAKQISARQVLAASGEKRAKLLLEYVKSRIGAVLKMAPDELADHDNINDMGLDSIMAVDLRNDINTTLNIDVPILMLMEGFCPEELAQAILKMLGSPQVESQTKPQALDLSEALQSGRVGELLTAMESLSDAEVEKMLESLGME
jgi:NAD(P)-dependent dehydrogenase (short-subunit alcohol dehydrogenase family)/aryl carrier-like protein